MNTPSRNLPLRVAWAAALLTGLLGCGAGDPDPDPPPSSSSPAETTSSDTAEPTDEPTETVSPASGDVVTHDQFSFTAPARWRVGESQLYVRSIESPPARKQARRGEPFGYIVVASGPSVKQSLDQLARDDVADGEGKRVADHELAGETVYHVSRPAGSFETNEVFGLWRDGEVISIRFTLIDGTPATRRAIVESVLATWEWRP